MLISNLEIRSALNLKKHSFIIFIDANKTNQHSKLYDNLKHSEVEDFFQNLNKIEAYRADSTDLICDEMGLPPGCRETVDKYVQFFWGIIDTLAN